MTRDQSASVGSGVRRGTSVKSFETAFGTYAVRRQIGEGGAGRVYEATDSDGRRVAVKVLSPDKATSERLKRFKNEITFCATAAHPNVVKVLDHGSIGEGREKAPFYVMELFDSSLRQLMASRLAPGRVLPIFLQVLNGVEAAHLKNVVHRDLKPENVLVNGAGVQVVVADFGIARFTEEDLYTIVETKQNERLCNFLYSAPEQRARGTAVDVRADLFSLGLLLNEMFTGEVPQGADYRTIASASQEHAYLDPIIRRMIQQAPSARPASIDEVKRELIAQERELVARQKVSELTHQVVPETDVDDPLVANPIQLVDFDWDAGILRLSLSQPVNPKWVWALQNMGSHTSVPGKGPESFRFTRDRAFIEARASDVQRIIDFFKGWLPAANRVYEGRIRREQQQERERVIQDLRAKREAAEERLRLMQEVKI